MKVLMIVDEEESFRRELAAVFTRQGFRVLQAEGAEAALKVMAEEKVNFVLAGIRESGVEWQTLLHHGAPLVIFTTPLAGVSRESARALGCSEVFDRPFSAAEIFAAVDISRQAVVPTLTAAISEQSIGRGGFSGPFPKELSPGTAVFFHLECDNLPIEGRGVVRWAKSENESGSLLGVEIVDLTEASEALFEAWREKHNPLAFIPNPKAA